MAVDAVGASTGASSGISRQTLASNFETFLTLLTTQLQHQNPLDPLDTNQFTQQLVAFAGVEQQLRTNDQLESLLKLQQVGYNVTALGFVGSHVTIDGASTELKDGLAVWYLSSPAPATAHIEIQDANGSAVYTETKTLDAATQPFQWNGKTSAGTIAPDGTYKIVVTAQDASGQAVQIGTSFSGVVDQVDISGEEPLLLIGATLTTMDKIRSVQRVVPAPDTNNPDPDQTENPET
jgi:flagellar basal-body rod modification protein FlgD